MKKYKSPCIDVCKFSGPHGWCLGCGRTKEEARKWRKLKPYDIQNIQKIIPKRMIEIKRYNLK